MRVQLVLGAAENTKNGNSRLDGIDTANQFSSESAKNGNSRPKEIETTKRFSTNITIVKRL